MREKDSLHRFIFENMPIRGEYVHLHESFLTIIHQHKYPPPVKKLLGEALCVVGLLSAVIKYTGRLTVQFRGKGKLKLLLAQCDSQFNIRGLAKWDGELNYRDLMNAFNEGVLLIMLDSGLNKSTYQGIVSWRGSSLVESIEGYFKESEQLATKLWLKVSEDSAAGFILQMVPAAKEGSSLEQSAVDPDWAKITGLSAELQSEDMLNLDFNSILKKLYPEEDIRVFPTVPINFGCTCSRKRGEDAILLLGKAEAEAELKDKHSILVTCDFCGREYIFDRADVEKIFSEDVGKQSDIIH